MSHNITPDFEGRQRVVIESVSPKIDGGVFPIKRVVGETVRVEADAFTDGHDAVATVLHHRQEAVADWTEAPMQPLVNDRWRAEFIVMETGRYRYTVSAWIERFVTWLRDFQKRVAAQRFLDSPGFYLLEAARLPKASGRAAGRRCRPADWRGADRRVRESSERRGCRCSALHK